MDSMVFQYVIIGATILAIIYALFRSLRKTFKKAKSGGGCDNNCGCS